MKKNARYINQNTTRKKISNRKRKKRRKSKLPLFILFLLLTVSIVYGCSNIGPFSENSSDQISSSQDISSEVSSEDSSEESSQIISQETPNPNPFSGVSFYIEDLQGRYEVYMRENPEISVEEVVLVVNMNLDYDFYENIQIMDNPDDLLAICNKYNKLPDDFVPKNLVSVPSEHYIHDGKTYLLDGDALAAFIQMANDAKQEELELRIISAYRTIEYQRSLYERYAARDGYDAADRFSARAGHSEHNMGLAVDINLVTQEFGNTPEFAWLKDNSYKYGFILRYLQEKEHETGYKYEPWHFRYVGTEVAQEIYELNITFDEYYAKFLLPEKYNEKE